MKTLILPLVPKGGTFPELQRCALNIEASLKDFE